MVWCITSFWKKSAKIGYHTYFTIKISYAYGPWHTKNGAAPVADQRPLGLHTQVNGLTPQFSNNFSSFVDWHAW